MVWTNSVLVVANVTANSDELLEELRRRAEAGPTRFTLLVPATGGTRGGRAAAKEQLDAATARMREAGLDVAGKVGDPDPVAAVHELWDPKEFDEIVISTLPTGSSRWLRIDLPHRVERLTGVPVTHVLSSPPRPPVKTAPPPKREKSGVLAPLLALGWGGREREDAER